MVNENEPGGRHTKRDSESLLMLGGFMAILAIPVLIGTFFADSAVAMIVNVVAGLLLLGAGLGFILRGRHIGKGAS